MGPDQFEICLLCRQGLSSARPGGCLGCLVVWPPGTQLRKKAMIWKLIMLARLVRLRHRRDLCASHFFPPSWLLLLAIWHGDAEASLPRYQNPDSSLVARRLKIQTLDYRVDLE
jgi:hypothetical protein